MTLAITVPVLALSLAVQAAATPPKPAPAPPAAKPTPAAAKPVAAVAKSAPAAAPAAKGSLPQGNLPLAEVVKKMQERYEKANDYRAKFTQKYTTAATGRERSSTGEVFIKKPGRMRFNYAAPEPQMYLSNGTTFWVYEPEAKQAFRQDLKSSQLPAAVSFLMGKGKLTDEFDVAPAKELPYGQPGEYKLALKPKKAQGAGTYKAIYFVVDPQTFLVNQSVLINAQGDINAFTFTEAKVDSKLPEATFKWTPPQGTRVVEGGK
jgi:outer membrane lipoprotein carrier protein